MKVTATQQGYNFFKPWQVPCSKSLETCDFYSKLATKNSLKKASSYSMTHCHGKYFSLENIQILVLVENSLSLPHPKKLNSMLRETLFFYAQDLLDEEMFSF